jgi:hypothetical protein
MRHRSTKALYAYWDHLRGEAPAPARTDINPRGIAAVLGDVFLLEGSGADFTFRLAGSRIIAGLGRPLTGQSFNILWRPAMRLAAHSALLAVAEESESILIGFRALTPTPDPQEPATARPLSRPSWPNFRAVDAAADPDRRTAPRNEGELLLLPLRHPRRAGSRVLGALALFEPPLAPPQTPLLLDIASTRILGRAARPRTGTGLVTGEAAPPVVRPPRLHVIEGSRTSNDPPAPLH